MNPIRTNLLHQRGTSYQIEVWNRPIRGIDIGSPIPDLDTTTPAKRRGKVVGAGRGISKQAEDNTLTQTGRNVNDRAWLAPHSS
ncbi:hypothetical protein PSTT_06460, partial [Puccinia striiformis]